MCGDEPLGVPDMGTLGRGMAMPRVRLAELVPDLDVPPSRGGQPRAEPGLCLPGRGGIVMCTARLAVGVRSWEPEELELSGVKIVSSKEETPTASFDARGLVLVGSGGASRVLLGEKRRLLVPGRYSCW